MSEEYRFAWKDGEGNLNHREVDPSMKLNAGLKVKPDSLEEYLNEVEVATLGDLLEEGLLDAKNPFGLQNEVNSKPRIAVMRAMPTTALTVPNGTRRFLGTDVFYLSDRPRRLESLLERVLNLTGVDVPPPGEYCYDITIAYNKQIEEAARKAKDSKTAEEILKKRTTDAETLAGLLYGVETGRLWRLTEFDTGKGPLFAARGTDYRMTYAELKLASMHPKMDFPWRGRMTSKGSGIEYKLPENLPSQKSFLRLTMRDKHREEVDQHEVWQYLYMRGPSTLTDLFLEGYDVRTLPETVKRRNINFMDCPTENGTKTTYFWLEDEKGRIVNYESASDHVFGIVSRAKAGITYEEVAAEMEKESAKTGKIISRPYGQALFELTRGVKKGDYSIYPELDQGFGPLYAMKNDSVDVQLRRKSEVKKELRNGGAH